MPSMDSGARRMTPGQATFSPLATVAVSRGRGWTSRPVRRAAASPMKLWDEPLSTRATNVAAPSSTRSKMEPPTGTPATAWSENTGASVSGGSAESSSSVSSATLSTKNRRLHTLLWPRVNFSSQLKHKPRRRRSSCSDWLRRRTGRPSMAGATVVGLGAEAWGGAVREPDAGRAGRAVALAGNRYGSMSSNCRARLMAAARLGGFCCCTWRLSGGSKPPVKSCTSCASSNRPARGIRAWKRSW